MTVALSTWTLDPILAARYPDSPSGSSGRADHTGTLEIEDVPAAAKGHGFDRLEVPHFHLPPDPAAFVRAAGDVEVTLQTLLIDDGDLTHPEHGARDEAWVAHHIERAAEMGFARVRIIAGKQKNTPESFARAVAALDRLTRLAEANGLRASTENWFDLLATSEAVHALLDALDGRLGLCADFGNWLSPYHHEALPRILSRAETVHAKADFMPDGAILAEPFLRQVEQAKTAGFDGPYVLVAGGPKDVWDGARATVALIRA